MLEFGRMLGFRQAVRFPVLLLIGVSPILAISDRPEPIGGALDDGPDPFSRGAAVAVIGDGPDPISGVVRLPTPAEVSDALDPINGVVRLPTSNEAINDNPDPFYAAINDPDQIVICFFDHGLDCVFLAGGQSAPVTPLQP